MNMLRLCHYYWHIWLSCIQRDCLPSSPVSKTLLGFTVHAHSAQVSAAPCEVASTMIDKAMNGWEGDSRNVHSLQLLEQQLGGVRQIDLRDLRAVAADGTVEFLLLEVGDCHETTLRPSVLRLN